ncbi:molecular chaperone DnaJ [Halioglobus japonicus]|uniref:Molecular chaperone DnaJ n=1 Tax=Halioglobus japonicus TaxID=930805 RepID=A0AAP8SPJ1_9GAMM|nr:DnaJ domain-containing protein [Halioglobus japonicus]AQA19716.1 molecular chaperone DnaJ [Halioglobus japonicus]PLW87213.1 molecular chaperone DnaJ [Halioglobus japonicus]GHD09627.1 molecular chaperone DnaJ [Halioglobus japonicus]
MPRLILLAAVAIVLYILLKRAQAAPPHKRRGEYIKLALGVAVVGVVILALAGKMHWIGVALTGLLVVLRQLGPTLIRFFPLLASRMGQAAPSGQQSTVATDILSMQLDHDSGELHGEVLEGPYKGWRLADMQREQLDELMAYCQSRDPDSVQLLQGYLEQRFGSYEGAADQTANEEPTGPGGLSRKEALAVLGLDESASDDDIVAAHRKLMQKLHPDRGGNDYLAAKINQAKDFLLG